MEDIGQLIFVVLFILFGLISSSKKKAQRTPRAGSATRTSPDRAPTRETHSSDGNLPVSTETAVDLEDPNAKKAEVAEELLLFLQGGKPEPEIEPIAAESEVDDEAQSIETLEHLGAESHKRFHESYVHAEPQPGPYVAEEVSEPRPYSVTETPVERPYHVDLTKTSQPYAIHDASDGKRVLTRRELRHAFVMKEILGPPKALE